MFTFEEWVDFTFGLRGEQSMLAFDRYPGPDDELLEHCLRFFLTASPILSQIPRDRSEKALSILPGVDGYLGILASPAIEFHLRAELATAHFTLFEQVFINDSYGSAAFMWWEHLRSAIFWKLGTHLGYDKRSLPHDTKLIDCLITAIEKILYLPSEICQESALHGLYELGYFGSTDRTTEIIKLFLATSTHNSPAITKYAREVAQGAAQ